MFVTDAIAQTQSAPAADTSPLAQFFGGGMSFPVMMLLMFGILYFMVIRPQGQERKKLERKISELKKGDKVLTTSGIFATVVSMESDRAVLRISDETKVEFAKSAIAQVLSPEAK